MTALQPGNFVEVPATQDVGTPALGADISRHCAKNEKTHRHLPAGLVDDCHSACRFCGAPIERAHAKSTWWTASVAAKPSKAQLRRGRKTMRKAFAKKDQVGSTRADAKRKALAYAERRTGRKLTWKAARKLIKRWAREEREVAA